MRTAEAAVPTVLSNRGFVKAVLAAYPCGWPAGAFATWLQKRIQVCPGLHCMFFLGVLKYAFSLSMWQIQQGVSNLFRHGPLNLCATTSRDLPMLDTGCLRGSHFDSWKPLAMGTGCWSFDRQLDGAAITALAPGISSETWTIVFWLVVLIKLFNVPQY